MTIGHVPDIPLIYGNEIEVKRGDKILIKTSYSYRGPGGTFKLEAGWGLHTSWGFDNKVGKLYPFTFTQPSSDTIATFTSPDWLMTIDDYFPTSGTFDMELVLTIGGEIEVVHVSHAIKMIG